MKKILFFCVLVCSTPLYVSALPPGPEDVQIDFRVKWDGRVIPGIEFISELNRKTEVIAYRNGASPNTGRQAPGLTAYQPLVLKRPRSMDIEFEQWANKVVNYGGGAGNEISLANYRKDIIIELVDKTSGRIIMAYQVYGCWPSEYIPLTTLDKNSDDPAMEVLILQYDGWLRDTSVR